MKKIKDFLEEDETILWKYSETKNLTKDFIVVTGLSISILITIIIGMIIVSIVEDIPFTDLLIALYISGAIIALCIIGSLSEFLGVKRRLHLSFKELKKYKIKYIITDKRYIQKTHWNHEVDFSRYPEKSLKRHKDIVFIDIKSVEAFYFEREHIGLYLTISVLNSPEISPLYISCNEEKAKEVTRILKELIPMEQDKEVPPIFYPKN